MSFVCFVSFSLLFVFLGLNKASICEDFIDTTRSATNCGRSIRHITIRRVYFTFEWNGWDENCSCEMWNFSRFKVNYWIVTQIKFNKNVNWNFIFGCRYIHRLWTSEPQSIWIRWIKKNAKCARANMKVFEIFSFFTFLWSLVLLVISRLLVVHFGCLEVFTFLTSDEWNFIKKKNEKYFCLCYYDRIFKVRADMNHDANDGMEQITRIQPSKCIW